MQQGRIAAAAAPWLRVLAWALARLLAGLVLATGAQAQASTTEPEFEIRRFAVEGNSLLTPYAVELALAPHTGPRRSFADVRAAVEALQRLYVDKGFGAVQVSLPEQRIADGVIRLAVAEPPLRSVTIEGNSHFDAAAIRRSLPALRRGATPNTGELAAQIRLANENPARRLSVDLKSDGAGGIDAIVTVRDDKPYKVGAVLDNTGTPATGRLRSGFFFQHANVAEAGQVFTGQFVTSPQHPAQVAIVAANHRVPLPSLGDSVDLYGVYADVDSGVVSELFNVRGRGKVAGTRLQHNLPPTAGYRHRLSVGLEVRAFDNRVGVEGSDPDLLADVTVHPASLGYSGSWSGEPQQLEFSGTVVRNFPGGSKGTASDFAAARAGADSRYLLLRWSGSYTLALPAGWQLRLAGDGQFSRDALVSGEQFGIGGQDSVRGFLEREISDDRGSRFSAELHSPDFGARLGPGVAAHALLFHDRGRVRRNLALPGETTKGSIASVGAGLRVSIPPHWQMRLDLAHVTRGFGERPRGHEHLHFSLGVAY
ncbi:MAG TPA: ShlB/FhaC/HecB family hemolysin secretion/activation protein [Caldimonas sp.]|jgi:hemolysin activation/secretion protein|nr:ShlB/FhaC/HecB family hemolysin secretion/activation protein [Caldimonas sp.]HEX2540689.1 ShlB/FhaC/HecB family hemolysin secretion/activation protein [Caldimonas sp.]